MSEDSGYHSPSPAHEEFDLSEIIRFNAEFDQHSVSTSAQPPPSSPHSYGPCSVFSSPSDLPWQNMDHQYGDPVAGTGSYSEGGHSSTYDQSMMLGSPLTSSGQPQSVNEELSTSGASVGDTFEVEISQASASDRDELIETYARASIDKPLNCCIVKESSNIEGHQEFGKFHYDQALDAAKTDALVLKATKTTSGEIVGCAWLQLDKSLYPNVKGRYRLGGLLPASHVVECEVYRYVHQQIHIQRGNAIRTHFEINGRYGPHCFVRSLDVLKTLNADNQEKVMRKLISFISEYDPDQEVFTWLSVSDLRGMKVLLDEGWVETGNIILGPPKSLGPSPRKRLDEKDCPEDVARILRDYPTAHRTLWGFLRPKRVLNSGSARN